MAYALPVFFPVLMPMNYGTMDDKSNVDATIIEMSELTLGLKSPVKTYFNETSEKIKKLSAAIITQQGSILTDKANLESQWAFFFAEHRFTAVGTLGLLIMIGGIGLTIATMFVLHNRESFQWGMSMAMIGCMVMIIGLRLTGSCRPKILKADDNLNLQLQEVNKRWSRHRELTQTMNQLAEFHEMLQQFRISPDAFATKYLFDCLDDLMNQVHKHESNLSKGIFKIILMDQLIKILPQEGFTQEWESIKLYSNINNIQEFSLWSRLGLEKPSQSDCETYVKSYFQDEDVASVIDRQISAFLNIQLSNKLSSVVIEEL